MYIGDEFPLSKILCACMNLKSGPSLLSQLDSTRAYLCATRYPQLPSSRDLMGHVMVWSMTVFSFHGDKKSRNTGEEG